MFFYKQPTTLEKIQDDDVSRQVVALLEARGFGVKETAHMDGWLAYHTVFISCIAAALMRAGVDPQKLAQDKQLLKLMCRAIEEGFRALHRQGVQDLPPNLGLLHSPLLRPIAVNYWRKTMQTKGEVYFAAHIRHAAEEMHMLRRWVLEKVTPSASVEHIRQLFAKL